jgi:hypothetical protein
VAGLRAARAARENEGPHALDEDGFSLGIGELTEIRVSRGIEDTDVATTDFADQQLMTGPSEVRQSEYDFPRRVQRALRTVGCEATQEVPFRVVDVHNPSKRRREPGIGDIDITVHDPGGESSEVRRCRRIGKAAKKAYLCDFSFAETGKRAPLGAYHGEELYLLSNSFPADWQDSWDDQLLGRVMRMYWAQFAKAGNPNAQGLPTGPITTFMPTST